MRLFFTSNIGVDLGTSNVLLYVENEGIRIREPSVVAMDKNSGKILQVGAAARNMLGRTPGNVVAMHPLREGVISDYEMTVSMLKNLFSRTAKNTLFKPKPRVIMCVPSGATEVEERTVINAAIEAGASRVYLIEEARAAALGAGLDISNSGGHMVVDIGGGVTNIAVLSSNEVASSSSIKIAGDAFDEAIARYIRRKYGVIIGQVTAEEIKMQICHVYPRQEEISMVARGRDAKSGAPRELNLVSGELFETMHRLARQIADEVLSVLEDTQPELVGDIAVNGITLTGGGSQLWGMDMLLSERTGITCTVADDPESCAARGCGMSLAWIKHMNVGPINLARKKIFRSK